MQGTENHLLSNKPKSCQEVNGLNTALLVTLGKKEGRDKGRRQYQCLQVHQQLVLAVDVTTPTTTPIERLQEGGDEGVETEIEENDG